MKRKRNSIILILILIITLAGCNSNSTDRNDSQPQDEPIQEINSETNTDVPIGDGTLTIKLNISNPDQAQDSYKVIFTQRDMISPGNAIINSSTFQAYDIKPGESLTINIKEISSLIYSVGLDEELSADLTVVRVEDTNVRNPLAEPISLTFLDTQTCIQGKEITVNMTDQPLTTLYPEGTFLIKIQQISSDDTAGYISFTYEPQDGGMTLNYGRGSSGPDYLVAFDAKDFKDMGIRDTILSITDFENDLRSQKVELHFDENGYCREGQFIIMEVIN
ncbi:MAG: hypothetical protein ACOWWR_16605 [Eubacteriales bacterium]